MKKVLIMTLFLLVGCHSAIDSQNPTDIPQLKPDVYRSCKILNVRDLINKCEVVSGKGISSYLTLLKQKNNFSEFLIANSHFINRFHFSTNQQKCLIANTCGG